MEIKQKLKEYATNPENPIINYDLGILYYLKGHYGSALNFFLRCAEISQDKIVNNTLSYKSLILCSNCLYRQGERPHSKVGFILHALSLIEKRPEAWFLYLRHLEENGSWQECYTFSGLALNSINPKYESFSHSDYPGIWAIKFIRAKSSFQIGRGEECRILLQSIVDDHWDQMDSNYRGWIEREIVRLGDGPNINHIIRYDRSKAKRFKFPFEGFWTIMGNYSQTYQDLFVLSILKGKREGTYLEVGSAHPEHNSNTALLESFDWKGVSIEIRPELVSDFNKKRKNSAICTNALEVNYKKLLKENFEGRVIDYLQLDCEPSKTTFEILTSIPFEDYKFAVITYEHDHSMDMTRTYRDKSRRFLESLGYVLVVNDVGPNDWFSYEDWWVHPDLIDEETLDKMKKKNQKEITNIENYFLF